MDKAPGPLPFRGQRPWQGQSMAIRSALGLRRSHQLAGSGALLSPSPPAEKATAHQEQAWKASSESVGRRNRPQLSLTGPAPCEASPGPHRSSATSAGRAFAPLRGLSGGLAWLDRLAIILSDHAWSVVAASVHSRASLRYSPRRRRSTVNSAARTQFLAWYS